MKGVVQRVTHIARITNIKYVSPLSSHTESLCVLFVFVTADFQTHFMDWMRWYQKACNLITSTKLLAEVYIVWPMHNEDCSLHLHSKRNWFLKYRHGRCWFRKYTKYKYNYDYDYSITRTDYNYKYNYDYCYDYSITRTRTMTIIV